VTKHPKVIATYTSFVLTEDTANEVLLLFGRQPLLHQTPVVRTVGAWTTFATVADSPVLPNFAPITGTAASVGPRFECLQTKRCALLWSVSYPCSIFHHLWSRFTTPRLQVKSKTLSLPQSGILRYLSARLLHRPLAVPPPPFHLLAYLRRCPARSELPLSTHSFDSFFRGFVCDHVSLFGLPVGSGLFFRLIATV
jgi:hypothetical protein